jgi:hypothetical protein
MLGNCGVEEGGGKEKLINYSGHRAAVDSISYMKYPHIYY